MIYKLTDSYMFALTPYYTGGELPDAEVRMEQTLDVVLPSGYILREFLSQKRGD